MRHVLIVIDMQQGPFGDSPPWYDAAGLLGRLNRLADAVRPTGKVVFIQHDGPPGDPYQPGSPGSRFLSALDVRAVDSVIHKAACDSFLDTSLEAFLRAQSIDRLIITGWATDYCVDTTVRSALARGYPTTVPSDGHTTSDRPHLSAAKIIEHHNAIWADFIAPRGPALVQPCAEVRLS
ncbi:MAG: cysteine hydrolase family protein [Reyranellaceae bacterium]